MFPVVTCQSIDNAYTGKQIPSLSIGRHNILYNNYIKIMYLVACLLQDNSEIYYMKGAPEKVLQQCTSYYRQGSVVPLGAKDLERFNDAVAAMSSRGLRGT